MIYVLLLVVGRRRIDRLALLAATGFALGCVGSLLLGCSSLPLKLHEALFTFAIGTVLLVAVLIRRPVPLGHAFRLPTNALDNSLGVMIGGFLVLHALIHVALAITLSTASYLVMSRVVNWATLAIGGLCLSGYLRRARER